MPLLTLTLPLADFEAAVRSSARRGAPAVARLAAADSAGREWLGTGFGQPAGGSRTLAFRMFDDGANLVAAAETLLAETKATGALCMDSSGRWQGLLRLLPAPVAPMRIDVLSLPGRWMHRVVPDGSQLAPAALPFWRRPPLSPAPNVGYSRTAAAIGWDTLARRQGLRVALVGVGGTGSEVACRLVQAGVSLTMIDPDTLARENLDRMAAALGPASLEAADKGRVSKVLALALRIADEWPGADIRALAVGVDHPAAIAAVAAADVVVDATDHARPRALINAVATMFLRVHLSLGTHAEVQPDGRLDAGRDVRLFLPGEGRCAACWGGFAHPWELRQPRAAGATDRIDAGLGWLSAGTAARAMELIDLLVRGDIASSTWVRDRSGAHGPWLASRELAGVGDRFCPVCHAAGTGWAGVRGIGLLLDAVTERYGGARGTHGLAEAPQGR